MDFVTFFAFNLFVVPGTSLRLEARTALLLAAFTGLSTARCSCTVRSLMHLEILGAFFELITCPSTDLETILALGITASNRIRGITPIPCTVTSGADTKVEGTSQFVIICSSKMLEAIRAFPLTAAHINVFLASGCFTVRVSRDF
jgi:hypothetical protein